MSSSRHQILRCRFSSSGDSAMGCYMQRIKPYTHSADEALHSPATVLRSLTRISITRLKRSSVYTGVGACSIKLQIMEGVQDFDTERSDANAVQIYGRQREH